MTVDEWELPPRRVPAGADGRTGRCEECLRLIRYSEASYTWTHVDPKVDHAPVVEREVAS